MPWPASLSLLLAMPDSRPGQAVRWGLCGLRASLQAALDESPDDPGSPALRELLGELEPLLTGGSPPADSMLPPSDPVMPSDGSADAPHLLSLAQSVAEDARLPERARRGLLQSAGEVERWNSIQRLLLRLPSSLAAEWREHSLKEVQRLGCRQDDSRSAVLPLPRDEVIYPGLAGAMEAPGLRATAGAALDPRLGESADPDLRLLAGLVSTCLWFIDNDDGLCHTLASVYRFGVTPLRGEQREQYKAELLRRWQRVRTAAASGQSRADFRERLKAHLALDEALHSLIYQPPAATDSWWGRLLSDARQVVFRVRARAVQAGCAVHLQLLAGPFADISHLAPDSLQVDFGPPGEVAICLRIWARLDGEEHKGRVLYRSPEDEA